MSKDWNTAYEVGDTPWDKGEAAPPLQEFLERRNITGSVLVPGCGSGHDVRLLAEQGADVLGLDIAAAAVRLAVERSKVRGECYAHGDFLNLSEDLRGQFDWLVEHTCLCALDPELRQAYAEAVDAAGGDDTTLFVARITTVDTLLKETAEREGSGDDS